MSDRDRYLVTELPGFTPQIGRLVSMLNYVRATTLTAVAGLSVDARDYVHDSRSNAIGALLLHIAAAEVGYQAASLHGRDMTDEEKHTWDAALKLGDTARREIRGHELDYYVSRLEQVRATTLAELAKRDDEWLERRTSTPSGREVNNYFKWFHVLGHEINHRGQITWLVARATGRPDDHS